MNKDSSLVEDSLAHKFQPLLEYSVNDMGRAVRQLKQFVLDPFELEVRDTVTRYGEHVRHFILVEVLLRCTID